jgi:acetylornithine deacetylase
MDTVPPFFPSSDDGEFLRGRGACDAKGIMASMIKAAEALIEAGESGFGLLFVVGEERNSAGAYHAAATPRGSRYLVNGEPTENKLALGAKGALRYEVVATGKMAHSAYPELGDSAIHKLIDALWEMRRIPLPVDEVLGASTLNIGTLSGGRAPNVVADEARAEILIRLVGDSAETKLALERAAAGRAELREILELPASRLSFVEGIETTVVAYTTDIPAFDGQWGEPFLIGPGSIHVAHTPLECVARRQLLDAAEIYRRIVRELCRRESK